MASPAAQVATGITLALGTNTAFNSVEITSVQPASFKRLTIDASHMGSTGAKASLVGKLYEVGEISLSGHFNPDKSPPTVNSAVTSETVTIGFPNGTATGATWSCNGMMTEYTPKGMNVDGMMEFDAKIKPLGAVTITPVA